MYKRQLGCVPRVIDENKVIQKIDSLDMTIFSKSGDKIYSITSPNSSYDNIELEFELKKPIINIMEKKLNILLVQKNLHYQTTINSWNWEGMLN